MVERTWITYSHDTGFITVKANESKKEAEKDVFPATSCLGNVMILKHRWKHIFRWEVAHGKERR